jgi:hypothetical protein
MFAKLNGDTGNTSTTTSTPTRVTTTTLTTTSLAEESDAVQSWSGGSKLSEGSTKLSENTHETKPNVTTEEVLNEILKSKLCFDSREKDEECFYCDPIEKGNGCNGVKPSSPLSGSQYNLSNCLVVIQIIMLFVSFS